MSETFSQPSQHISRCANFLPGKNILLPLEGIEPPPTASKKQGKRASLALACGGRRGRAEAEAGDSLPIFPATIPPIAIGVGDVKD